MSIEKFDLVIIGGGPGGYPAAIRASQLGASVALVEEDKLGGECTNYGCVPTKSLVTTALTIKRLSRIRKVNYDLFEEAYREAERIAEEVSSGVTALLKGYGVQVFKSRARFSKEGYVELDNGLRLKADRYIIATGTDPQSLPGVSFDGEVIHNNRTILKLKRKPSSIIIIGGGYVGVEIAYVMASLGVDVTLVEALDRLLFYLDRDLSRYVLRILRRARVKVKLRSPVRSVERRNNEVVVKLGNEELSAEKALIAVGRKPRLPNGIEYLGVRIDAKGYIPVDDNLRTSNPNVFATGDISGPPLLAHKAMIQAEVAAENSQGLDRRYSNFPVPQVTFTEPEIASVGLTLEEARSQGINALEVKLPTGGLARSRIEDVADGFVKIVYEESTRRVLGVHMAGPMVSELVAEATLMVKLGLKLEEVSEVMHPHPTASEALREAVLLALKRPIHYILRLRR